MTLNIYIGDYGNYMQWLMFSAEYDFNNDAFKMSNVGVKLFMIR